MPPRAASMMRLICSVGNTVAASSVKTEEKKSRPVAALVPGWVVLVEGGAGREALEHAVRDLLDETTLDAAGAQNQARGIYVLQASLAK